jgi:hypothetical protein
MSGKGTNDKVTSHKSNIAGTEDVQEGTGENAAGPRGELARKSNDITRTPTRGKVTDVTPALKKASKSEQSAAKKTRQVRKKGLLQYFGDGLRLQPPSSEGTQLDAVKMRREKKGNDSNPTKLRHSKEHYEAQYLKRFKCCLSVCLSVCLCVRNSYLKFLLKPEPKTLGQSLYVGSISEKIQMSSVCLVSVRV